MLNRSKAAALVLACMIVAGSAQADMFSPSHGCRKPYKPYKFTNEWEIDNFKNEVDDYKQCINDFVEEQNDAIQNHKDAAEEAIDDWNRFVSYELK